MSEIRDNLHVAQQKVDKVVTALDDVTGGYGEMRVNHVAYLMTTAGEFITEDAQGVYDAIDAALEEIDRLEKELEGKNYELEMVKMEMEVLREA